MNSEATTETAVSILRADSGSFTHRCLHTANGSIAIMVMHGDHTVQDTRGVPISTDAGYGHRTDGTGHRLNRLVGRRTITAGGLMTTITDGSGYRMTYGVRRG